MKSKEYVDLYRKVRREVRGDKEKWTCSISMLAGRSTEWVKSKEYVDLYRKVRREVKGDKEKWMDETMQGMEEDMRRHQLLQEDEAADQQQSDTSIHHNR